MTLLGQTAQKLRCTRVHAAGKTAVDPACKSVFTWALNRRMGQKLQLSQAKFACQPP
jgi:hypothetical protein